MPLRALGHAVPAVAGRWSIAHTTWRHLWGPGGVCASVCVCVDTRAPALRLRCGTVHPGRAVGNDVMCTSSIIHPFRSSCLCTWNWPSAPQWKEVAPGRSRRSGGCVCALSDRMAAGRCASCRDNALLRALARRVFWRSLARGARMVRWLGRRCEAGMAVRRSGGGCVAQHCGSEGEAKVGGDGLALEGSAR